MTLTKINIQNYWWCTRVKWIKRILESVAIFWLWPQGKWKLLKTLTEFLLTGSLRATLEQKLEASRDKSR